MANSNTFAAFSAAYPSGHPFALPAAFTTTTSTETAFLLVNGNQAIIGLPLGTEKLGSQTPFSPNANSSLARESGARGSWMGENRPFFNSSSFDNRPFKLRASGYIAGGLTTLTLVSASINIYAAMTTATVVTSGTEIANIAITGGIGGAKANWMVECTFQWDSVSQILEGSRSGFVGNLLTSGSVGTSLTAVTSLSLSSVNFGLSWVFATTSTSNKIGLTELALESI